MPNNMHNLNFDATSNIQHTYFHTSAAEQVHMPMNNYQGQTNIVSSANLYETSCANNFNTVQQGVSYAYSLAASSQYLIPSQSMPMNEKIGHTDFSYPANYSQPLYDAQHISRVEVASSNSAPYASANTHIPAPNVSNTYRRINENSGSIHTPPRVNSSCVSSYASSHNFGTTHSPLLKVHASDFANKAAPNSVSTILQKPNIFWDTELAEMKKDVVKRFSKDKKSEDKLNKFAETQVRLYKSCFQEIEQGLIQIMELPSIDDIFKEMRLATKKPITSSVDSGKNNNSDMDNNSVKVRTESNNDGSESTISQGTNLAVQKHVRSNKIAILEFPKAEGVAHLSGDYHIINRKFWLRKV